MPVLRIATWNCQHGHPDPAKLAAAAATLDVDVLALQEVDRGSSRVDGRDLAIEAQEAYGGELVWARAVTMRGGGDYGHALLVRGDVRDPVVHPLLRFRGGEQRVLLLAGVRVDGRWWSVAATHLTTRSSTAVEQLVQVLDLLGDRPGPRVLVGDLNLQPGQLLPWLSAEGYRLAAGPPTYPVDRPRLSIDHVAVTGRGCTVTVTETRALPVGDHRALLTEVWAPG